MHVLVIGGEGYIGTHYTLKMLELGHHVTTLDCGNWSVKYNEEYDKQLGERFNFCNQQLRRCRASVINFDRLSSAITDVDMVVYLAARTDWTSAYRYPIRLVDVHMRGLVNTLSLARKYGVTKIIYASSYDVYGSILDAKETDVLLPVSMFGATKVSAEYICRGFWEEYGLEIVILRMFNVWGKYGSHSVLDRFVRDEKYPIYGDGLNTKDFVHVDDVVRAMCDAYMWDAGIYNIGSGEEVTLLGLWRMIHGENKQPTMEPYPKTMNPNQIARCYANTEFTANHVGWDVGIKISSLNPFSIRSLSGVTK